MVLITLWEWRQICLLLNPVSKQNTQIKKKWLIVLLALGPASGVVIYYGSGQGISIFSCPLHLLYKNG